MVLSSAMRPDWVNLYLANTEGETRGAGSNLFTGIDDNLAEGVEIPESHIIVQNYPNPFNSSTIINFSIPYHMTNSLVKLTIYNIQGKVITVLLENELPLGNYLINWSGVDQFGNEVASGIYLYDLKVGDHHFTGKMNLVK
jgi:hypothetical protein